MAKKKSSSMMMLKFSNMSNGDLLFMSTLLWGSGFLLITFSSKFCLLLPPGGNTVVCIISDGNCRLIRISCHNRSVEICVEPWGWLDCLFTFLFFCRVKIRWNPRWNIFIVITKPFLCLEGALKLISQEQFKTQQQKYSKFDAIFPSLTQISTLRVWHDLCINSVHN